MIVENEKIENLYSGGIKTISMNRINYGNKRLYVSTEPFRVYSGLTGALTAATFKGNVDGKRLDKWREKMTSSLGKEGQEAYLNSMADFGTLVHSALVSVWNNKSLNWADEQDYAYKFFTESAKKNGINPNDNVVRAQVYEYCKAAASIMQFVYDEVDEIYSIEGMCKSDILEIATPIDLTCKLKGGKVATLNIKTSAQIGDHQREQCAIEKYLWNATYPDCQASHTGIIRPKAWKEKKGIPTYEFELLKPEEEIQMTADAVERLLLVKRNINSTYLNYPKEISIFEGVSKLGEAPKIVTKTLEQVFTENQLQTTN